MSIGVQSSKNLYNTSRGDEQWFLRSFACAPVDSLAIRSHRGILSTTATILLVVTISCSKILSVTPTDIQEILLVLFNSTRGFSDPSRSHIGIKATATILQVVTKVEPINFTRGYGGFNHQSQ